jgi:hypothetical protein
MRETTQLSPGGALALGAVLVAVGLVIILLGLGIVPARPSTIHAPGWIIVCAGLLFIICGAMVVNGYGFGPSASADVSISPRAFPVGRVRSLQDILALGVFGLMTLIDGWVAFGGGPRQFTSSDLLSTETTGNSRSGRVFFGFMFAVLLLCFFVTATTVVQRWRAKR